MVRFYLVRSHETERESTTIVSALTDRVAASTAKLMLLLFRSDSLQPIPSPEEEQGLIGIPLRLEYRIGERKTRL